MAEQPNLSSSNAGRKTSLQSFQEHLRAIKRIQQQRWDSVQLQHNQRTERNSAVLDFSILSPRSQLSSANGQTGRRSVKVEDIQLQNQLSWKRDDSPTPPQTLNNKRLNNRNRWGTLIPSLTELSGPSTSPESLPNDTKKDFAFWGQLKGITQLQTSFLIVNTLVVQHATAASICFLISLLTYNNVLPLSEIFPTVHHALWILIASASFLLLLPGLAAFASVLLPMSNATLRYRLYSATLVLCFVASGAVTAAAVIAFSASKDLNSLSGLMSNAWDNWGDVRIQVEDRFSCCGFVNAEDRVGGSTVCPLNDSSNNGISSTNHSDPTTLLTHIPDLTASSFTATSIGTRKTAAVTTTGTIEPTKPKTKSSTTSADQNDASQAATDSPADTELATATLGVTEESGDSASRRRRGQIGTTESLITQAAVPPYQYSSSLVPGAVSGCQVFLQDYLGDVLRKVYIVGFTILAISCVQAVLLVAVRADERLF